MPLETRHEAIIGLATEGDRLGYDGFFMPETWGYDMTVSPGQLKCCVPSRRLRQRGRYAGRVISRMPHLPR